MLGGTSCGGIPSPLLHWDGYLDQLLLTAYGVALPRSVRSVDADTFIEL